MARATSALLNCLCPKTNARTSRLSPRRSRSTPAMETPTSPKDWLCSFRRFDEARQRWKRQNHPNDEVVLVALGAVALAQKQK